MRNKKETKNLPNYSSTDITRTEAIKKAGKYAAFTAATMIVILSPKESQAQSPADPGSGWGG